MYLQSKIKVLGSSRDKIKLFLLKKLVKDFNIWWIILFIKYSIFHIILRIEMSVVNFKIIFVKKQKQTRERPTQGRGGTFIITEMAVFTLPTNYSGEMGYPFDNSHQIGNTS